MIIFKLLKITNLELDKCTISSLSVSFFFWSLCCLFFFDIRILIASLVSSNSSYYFWLVNDILCTCCDIKWVIDIYILCILSFNSLIKVYICLTWIVAEQSTLCWFKITTPFDSEINLRAVNIWHPMKWLWYKSSIDQSKHYVDSFFEMNDRKDKSKFHYQKVILIF
jgi:hypothetical protein